MHIARLSRRIVVAVGVFVAGAAAVATTAVFATASAPVIHGTTPAPVLSGTAASNFGVLKRTANLPPIPAGAAQVLADLRSTPAAGGALTQAEAGRLVLSTAPGPNGEVCFTGPAGAGCLTQFPANGVAFTTGTDTYGATNSNAHQVVAGVVADDVTSLTANVGDMNTPIQLQNGGFIYVSPEPGAPVTALTVTHTDGSTSSVRVEDANAASN
jgi:hypothetical protein